MVGPSGRGDHGIVASRFGDMRVHQAGRDDASADEERMDALNANDAGRGRRLVVEGMGAAEWAQSGTGVPH